MACNSPEFASQGSWATVIAVSDHTTTSNNSAMVPKNLRVRIVMRKYAARCQCAPCAQEGADYKVRANSFKRSVDDRHSRISSPI
jgi:hypothetical protein